VRQLAPVGVEFIVLKEEPHVPPRDGHAQCRLCFALTALLLSPLTACAQDALKAELAPGGKLRVALIGVRVLGGVGEPVGRFLAERLGLPFEPLTYPNPKDYEDALCTQ
jgi:hypothetical protein